MTEVGKKLFILGAGFDRAIFGDSIPLNDDLFTCLSVEFQGTASQVTGCLKHFEKKYQTSQIEEFLTFLDIEISRLGPDKWVDNYDIKTFRQNFNILIADYFARYRFKTEIKDKVPWLERFISQCLSADDAIVSLNYTCILEGALDYFEKWSPFDGYARTVDPPFDSASHESNKDLLNIIIYKIHGSENFLEAEYADQLGSSYIGFKISPEIFPRSGKNSFLGIALAKNAYIIAPSFVKVPHVQMGYMMTDILIQASSFRELIIMGCSLRMEDNFLWLLISAFLGKKFDEKRIFICDPAADSIKEKIVQYYGGLIRNFLNQNVITLTKGCQDSIDELCEQLV